MKKGLLLGIFIFMSVILLAQESTSANDAGNAAQRETHVTQNEARAVGLRFLNANTGQTRSIGELQMVKAYRTTQNDTAFYIFNTANGFVIVSADRCATPILGYSNEGPFNTNNVPVQMQGYLQGFVEQIAYGIGQPTVVDTNTAQQWQEVKNTGGLTASRANVAIGNNLANTAMASNHMTKSVMMVKDSAGKMVQKEVSFSDLMNGNAEDSHIMMPTLPQNRRGGRSGETGVGPLITSNWDQGCYYNALCPADANGDCGHTLTGCVATAMGMIMHYWGYPAQGSGTHSYMPYGYPEQTVNFGTTTYDWTNMPDQLTAISSQAEIDAVSTLLWHCGVAVDMVYGTYSSSAWDGFIPDAFHDYFGYCTSYYRYKTDDSTWLEMVKSSIDQQRPLLYFAMDATNLGDHAFVCDGYDASDNLHFNWGWGGNGNGYFAVDALNVNEFHFNNDIRALFGIVPQSEFQLHYNIIEGGAEVTYEQPIFGTSAYSIYPDTIVIPSQVTIDGTTYPVIAIGDNAFQCCWDLKSVEMPHTIIRIGDYAFNSDYQITHLDLPDSLTVLGEAALEALSLSSLELPDGLRSIGEFAFSFMNFMNYDLGLNEPEDYLTSITIPQTVTSVGHGLCLASYIDTVNWNADSCELVFNPNFGIWELWSEASQLNIGNHVRYIPRNVFMDANWETVTIPESVVSIGQGAFSDCPLNLVNFNAEHCSNVVDGIFFNCPTIVFGNIVKEIPSIFCIGNDAITQITIPESVTHIGSFAFCYCSNLHTINMLPSTPPTIAHGEFAFLYNAEGRIIVIPCEFYDAYCSDYSWNWKYKNDLRTIPETDFQLTAISSDTAQGKVVLYKNASVCDSTTIFFAKAHFGYHFDHWHNGSTTNPETLFLDKDTTVVAYFAKDQFDVTGLAGRPVFRSNFDIQKNDSLWILKNENYNNKWYIDGLEGNRALFISNNGGLSNAYDSDPSAVLAYKTLCLDSGHYLFSFDWRSAGNVSGVYSLDFSGGDRLSMSIYPGDARDIPLTKFTFGNYYHYYDDILYYGSNTVILSSNNDWNRYYSEIEVQNLDTLSILFYWFNMGQEPNDYPAAIDNVLLGTLDTIRGHVIGAENVDYLDTVTITAVPNPGYRFVCWYDYDTSATKQVVVTGALSLIAYFEAEHSVVVNSADTTMGTVSGGGLFVQSEDCTLTAIPREGHYFQHWEDGNTENPRTITVTQDTIMTAFFEICSDIQMMEMVNVCNSYVWNESIYSESGDYVQTFTTTSGCDSVVTLHLTVNYSNSGDTTAIACDSFDWYEQTNLTQSGDYTRTFTNVSGCDSVVTLHLTVNYSNSGDTTAVACNSFDWYEQTNLTQSGDYTRTLTNDAGCDSVVTLHLTVNYATHNVETETACESFMWHGTEYTTSGTYTYEYTNPAGCASVDTLHLIIKPATSTQFAETACDTYVWNGTTYSQTGDYTQTFTAANGCDSVVTLHLTVNYSNTGDTTVIVCNSFDWHEYSNLTQSGDYTRTLTNVNGCDSVVTLHLTVNHSVAADEYLTICENELPYTYGDTVFEIGTPELSITHYPLSTVDGCDSVVTLHLTINPTEASEFSITTPDSCYEWNSETYCTSGDYTQTLQTVHGCDSVVTLHLTITVGIDDHNLGATMTVYPNPTTGMVNVQCTMNNGQEGAVEFHVFDAFGKLVGIVETLRATSLQTDAHGSSVQTAQIDMSGFAAGVYFIKAVADGNVVAVRKVISN